MRWTKNALDELCQNINKVTGEDYYIYRAYGKNQLADKPSGRTLSLLLTAGEMGLFLSGFLRGAWNVKDSQKEEA